MSEEKKSLLQKIKALFNEPVVIPPATPVVVTATSNTYKTKDGATELVISQSGQEIAIGDTVMVAGSAALPAEYELESGYKIKVGEGGAITEVEAPAPVTQTPEEMAAAEAAKAALPPVVLTAESAKEMYEKFAVGTPEERMANLEIMVKALMECNFGYEIRKGQDAAAIQTYKDTLAPTQAALSTAQEKLATQATALQAAEQKIEKYGKVIEQQFELIEKIIETPTANPVTLNGSKKDRFDKLESLEKKFEQMGEFIANAKKQRINPATV